MTAPTGNGNGAAGNGAAGNGANGDLLSAVLRLTGMAAELEHAREQIAGLQRELGTLGGRADGIEERLAEVGGVLERMSGQIAGLTSSRQGQRPKDQDEPAYQVNPAPPWWRPADPRCADTTARLRDWVAEVYRPVFGYLAGLLAPCWDQHPLCLTYLDTLHEAWCLLYLGDRDPKMVFAQLDWLTRPLLQAAEAMANDTRACRDRGHHRDPSPAGPVPAALNDSV
jgi:hypothetical protein